MTLVDGRTIALEEPMDPMLADALARIEAVQSVEDERELAALDDAVVTVLASPEAELGIRTLLRVFERFPVSDGYGIFWSILHGVERMPGRYESALVESCRRAPSRFTLTMVNRLLNGGQAQVGGIALIELLAEAAHKEDCPTGVREDARRFLEYQHRKDAHERP
jgi:hypothetical protein